MVSPGIGYDDCNNNFKAGEGAMTITGSWFAPRAYDRHRSGIRILPPAGLSGKQTMAIGGVGIPTLSAKPPNTLTSQQNIWIG